MSFVARVTKQSGTQPTEYHIEMFVQSGWVRTKHSFKSREEAKARFFDKTSDDPRGWYRLVSATVLETVTP